MATLEQKELMAERAIEIEQELENLAKQMIRCANRINPHTETTPGKLDWMSIRYLVGQGDRSRTSELLRVVAGHVDLIIEKLAGRDDDDE